jgi:hypothetical protein
VVVEVALGLLPQITVVVEVRAATEQT